MIKIINAKVVKDTNELCPVEVLIDQDKITAIEENSRIQTNQPVDIIDAGGKLLTPGFVDLHVHFREPGFEYKETIFSGSRAAAKGGYTTVLAMPNTNPVLDTTEVLNDLKKRIKQDSMIETLFYSAITLGEKGEELVDFAAQQKAGAVAFSDDGRGVQSAAMMYDAMLAVKEQGSILVAHCEENSLLRGGYIHAGEYAKAHHHKGILRLCEDLQIARDCAIALETGTRYHICHMSTASGTDLLRYYKGKCNHISGEVTPHHLLLCDQDLQENGDFKMNPPLRGQEDREALIKALADGTIACIATDHAPHSAEEKAKGLNGSPFGIIGLETAFPLLYTELVLKEKLGLYRLVEAMTTAPAGLFGLEGHKLEAGSRADLVLIDLGAEYVIRKQDLVGKSKNTPFAGFQVKGKIDTVFYKGKMVVKGGQIIE
ncbi:dihydroorotase [Clostridiales bacterium COT073_COT-073]|nr:dihydroorotase [Clostridiales bacterium COT073_COT-073]